MRPVQTEYCYKENAPAVNSIKPVVAVAILNSKHELLILTEKCVKNLLLYIMEKCQIMMSYLMKSRFDFNGAPLMLYLNYHW